MVKHHLRELGDLCSYTVVASGTPLGTLSGLITDSENWAVNDFVVSVKHAPESPVLFLPAESFSAIDDEQKQIDLDISDDLVRAARQNRSTDIAGSKLLDATAIVGQRVYGFDGLAGKVTDLLVNINIGALRYFVIATATQRVLTDIEWCSSYGHGDERLSIDLPRAAIETAPPYESLDELCRGYEEALYRHYTSRAFSIKTGLA